MYFFINTTNYEYIFLALINKKGDIIIQKNIKAKYQQSEKLLENIDKILNNPVKSLRDHGARKLKGIISVIGPGGFTSLRIGIATANAMAWALNIPIVGIENKDNLDNLNLINKNYKKIIKLKKFKQVLPKYGQEPNITLRSLNFARDDFL